MCSDIGTELFYIDNDLIYIIINCLILFVNYVIIKILFIYFVYTFSNTSVALYFAILGILDNKPIFLMRLKITM